MSDQEHRPQEKTNPADQQPDGPEAPPPPGKRFQIILVQTIVFAAVFLTLLWLVEQHSAVAAIVGVVAIAYLLINKKTG